MKRIIYLITVAMMFSITSAFATNCEASKPEATCSESTKDTIIYITVEGIEYELSSAFAEESAEMLNKASKIYAVSLFKKGDKVWFGDWADVAMMDNGKYLINCGKTVKFNPNTNKINPIKYERAIKQLNKRDWYEFNGEDFGYCFADRVNPEKDMDELTILIYE